MPPARPPKPIPHLRFATSLAICWFALTATLWAAGPRWVTGLPYFNQEGVPVPGTPRARTTLPIQAISALRSTTLPQMPSSPPPPASGTFPPPVSSCPTEARSTSMSARPTHIQAPPASSSPPTCKAATTSPSRLPSSTIATARLQTFSLASVQAIPPAVVRTPSPKASTPSSPRASSSTPSSFSTAAAPAQSPSSSCSCNTSSCEPSAVCSALVGPRPTTTSSPAAPGRPTIRPSTGPSCTPLTFSAAPTPTSACRCPSARRPLVPRPSILHPLGAGSTR